MTFLLRRVVIAMLIPFLWTAVRASGVADAAVSAPVPAP